MSSFIYRKLPVPVKRFIQKERAKKLIVPVLNSEYEEEEKILLTGWYKSGNTWLRFLIYHLFALENGYRMKPLTYSELNELQKNDLGNSTVFDPKDGFPMLFRTHWPKSEIYESFDKIINIHRNPLDTLVSAYHFYKNRKIPFNAHPFWVRNKLFDINEYVKYVYPKWKAHQEGLQEVATVQVSYEELQSNTEETLKRLAEEMNWEFTEENYKKAIELSSFGSIKKMGRESGELGGMGAKNDFKGEFTRKGMVGAFFNELEDETIEMIVNDFPDFNEVYGIYIDDPKLDALMH